MVEDDAEAPEGEDTEAQPQGSWIDRAIKSPNLATEVDDETLAQMGSKVVDEYKIDEESREASGWNERYDAAMKLAMQVKEEKSYPWPKASNVKFPLLSTASIQFNARAYPAIIDGPQIVKGAVQGQATPEKTARADRVGKHMSWQLLVEMDGWEEDTDRLLIQLPIVGCAFRKSWFDPIKGYNCSYLVSAKDFVVNYWTKDLESCPRATHVLTFYPYEIEEKKRAGVWLDVELGKAPDATNDEEAPHRFLEQYRLWDLDDDGYPEPYTITVHEETQRVVRIVARFDERGVQVDAQGQVVRIRPNGVFTKYGFIPSPDGSFYDMGFGTLLGPLSETINTTINQLMDAGHLANVQGGFIGEGVSIKSGSLRFSPGEWKRAGSSGGPLGQQIVPLPVKEPSAVLFQMLGLLIESAKDVTATQDILGGDAGSGSLPVGTVSALIEQGLKTFTAIVKRLHRSLKKELDILYRLNGRYLNQQQYFTFQDIQGVVAQQDYAEDDLDIVPVSDPNMATDMQRMSQAQFLMQFMQLPGANAQAIMLRAFQAARVPNPQELFAAPQPNPAVDARVNRDNAAAEKDKAVALKTTIEAGVGFGAVHGAAEGMGHVQPQELPGMEGQSAPGGVPAVPQGLLGGPGQEVGAGGGDVPGAADAGQALPGAGGPGMG